MVFEKNFLRLTVAVRFQKKNEHSKNFLILFFKSTSYKNVVETKQIYFSPNF